MSIHCFGGDDTATGYGYGAAADSSALRNPATVEATFFMDRAPVNIHCIISKGGLDATTKASFWIGYRTTGGVTYLRHGFYTSAGAAKVRTIPWTLTVGRWYTVLWELTTGTGLTNLWICARESPTAAMDSAFTLADTATWGAVTPNPCTSELRIGAGSTATGTLADGWYGLVTEVKLYGVVVDVATAYGRLTERQVGDEESSGMTGYWRLDDGLGGKATTTAYNRAFSNAGQTVALKNGAQWGADPLDLSYESGILTGGFLGAFSLTRRVGTVLTSTDAATARPLTNLLSPRKARTYRTADTTGSKLITWAMADAVSFNCLTIENHNLTTFSGIQWKASDDSGFASYIFGKITIHPGRIVHFFDAPLQYKYFRLQLDDTNPDGYIELGTADLWHGIPVPTADLEGRQWVVSDPSVATVAEHGARSVRSIERTRNPTLGWKNIRRGLAARVMEVCHAIGGAEPVFVCADIKMHAYAQSWYGYLTGLPSESLSSASWEVVDLNGLSIDEDRAA